MKVNNTLLLAIALVVIPSTGIVISLEVKLQAFKAKYAETAHCKWVQVPSKEGEHNTDTCVNK